MVCAVDVPVFSIFSYKYKYKYGTDASLAYQNHQNIHFVCSLIFRNISAYTGVSTGYYPGTKEKETMKNTSHRTPLPSHTCPQDIMALGHSARTLTDAP